MKTKIQPWNQPEGVGHGWAPCSSRKAERFFVIHSDTGEVLADFSTHERAKTFVETLDDIRGRLARAS
jgi:hypothetical protein